MISEARLAEIVAEALRDGKNASQVSRRTGIPVERVQLAMHRARGTDPVEANRETRRAKRKEGRRIFGHEYTDLKSPGSLPRTGRGARGQ